MRKEDCFQVGQFIRLHGFKGEINIRLEVDEPLQYAQMESVFVEINRELIPFFFERFDFVKDNIFRVKIEGVDSEEDARTLMKKNCFLPLEFLPKLEDHQFYFHEITGFKAIDTELGEIGTIQSVIEGGAQDIFQIQSPKGKEILLPVVDDFIVEVDKKNKQITFNTPEGLVDFYLNN